jgi:hypothetical protein
MRRRDEGMSSNGRGSCPGVLSAFVSEVGSAPAGGVLGAHPVRHDGAHARTRSVPYGGRGHALSVGVAPAQFQLRSGRASLRGFLQPVDRSPLVLPDPSADVVAVAEVVLGLGVSLLCGQTPPLHRLASPVRRACVEMPAERVLRFCKPLLGGSAPPRHRLVPPDRRTRIEMPAEPVARHGVTTLGLFAASSPFLRAIQELLPRPRDRIRGVVSRRGGGHRSRSGRARNRPRCRRA